MFWKYALIEINYPDLWEADDKYCELVELYEDSSGQYTSFSKASVHSLKELEDAFNDVQKDGVNTWFAKNGEFKWDKEDKSWDWTKDNE
jgi:hypothetical protein